MIDAILSLTAAQLLALLFGAAALNAAVAIMVADEYYMDRRPWPKRLAWALMIPPSAVLLVLVKAIVLVLRPVGGMFRDYFTETRAEK